MGGKVKVIRNKGQGIWFTPFDILPGVNLFCLLPIKNRNSLLV